MNDAAEAFRQAATDDTNIIFGATVDERLAGQVWVTVVATGRAARDGDDADVTGDTSRGEPRTRWSRRLPARLDERDEHGRANAAPSAKHPVIAAAAVCQRTAFVRRPRK